MSALTLHTDNLPTADELHRLTPSHPSIADDAAAADFVRQVRYPAFYDRLDKDWFSDKLDMHGWQTCHELYHQLRLLVAGMHVQPL